MKGYIYKMFKGADPGKGWVMTDPIFTPMPTFGACQPRIRRYVEEGDYIFAISGLVTGVKPYVVGGFEVDKKISMLAAREIFPENISHEAEDKTRRGNIIIDADGTQIAGDYHSNLERRIENYIIGKNPVVIEQPNSIEIARVETLSFLNELFDLDKPSVFEIVGQGGRRLNERQIERLKFWMEEIKSR